jgi:error-prone DNA polymerase
VAARAADLGYEALALTDHDAVCGSLEFAHAAKAFGVRPITGAELSLAGGAHVTLLVETPRGYANLCRLLTEAHARTRPKEGAEPLPPELSLESLLEHAEGLVCLSGCAQRGLGVRDPNAAALVADAFRDRFYVELQRPYERGDARRNAALRELARVLGVATVATGDVHVHHARRSALQDALVAIRCRTSLDGCEQERRGNHESALLAPEEMVDRFPDDRDAVLRTGELAATLAFDLTEELGYRYPDFSDGFDTPDGQLAQVCWRAFEDRYTRSRYRRRAAARLREELALISELKLAGFFLLHWEVLELAREVAVEVRGPGSPRLALPPGRGRGSSVGSIVCYLTGLSHVDPVEADLSIGRFLNRELVAAPDIDLDFPRDIREQLIVRVTERYGREHAALVAAFSTYHSRGAIRDLGRALGLPAAELERLARVTEGNPHRVAEEVERLPGDHVSARWRALGTLAHEIAGLPRHISQHPGGMVISSRPLVELVPVQPAAMAGRQICQWDKDSCADAGFLKIDLLGLGMLSAVEDCVDQIARLRGTTIDLSRVPLDDRDVYAEIQRADTVGDFQIESRAQMQSLLRTLPENLDDLTIQVALVRPGPIQGGAVHPYIERRQKLREDPSYVPPVDHPSLAEPLRETLGVVVFQDQVLEVATALAGFTVGEAEGLRRAMSRKRSEEAIEALRSRFVAGALAQGIDGELANTIYDKLAGFSGFGFPKSHSAAFALLAYQSAWLRHHYPAEFLCALLNAQPMGFYPPASLVRDGQRRGVEVLPPDVNRSAAKCVNEGGTVRIGLGYVRSVGEAEAEAVAAGQPYADVADLARRAPVSGGALEALVASGACDRFGARRELLWRVGVVPRPAGAARGPAQLVLPLEPTAPVPELPSQTDWERMLADYALTSLSVGTHPLELLRPHLPAGTLGTNELAGHPPGEVAVAGMAIARQRPATANGVVFMLLEDETGQVNLIVPPPVYEQYRPLVRRESLLLARGRLERDGRNLNVLVRQLDSLGPLAREVAGLAEVQAALPRAHHFGHR